MDWIWLPVGLDNWRGSDWIGLEWIGLDWDLIWALGWNGLEWIGSEWWIAMR